MDCPHCGARVKKGAKSCPECGSDEETGWADDETVDYEAVDLPDSYEPERWEKEIERDRAKRSGMLVIAAIVAILFACVVLGVRFGR